MYLSENKLVTSTPSTPFGTPLYNRGFVFSGGYKYGFNGQEKDEEIAGKGNTNTAMHWEYDTRLGRRWNLDPVEKIGMSGYMCFSGNPILHIDVNGDDDVFDRKGNFLFSTKTGTMIKVVTPEGVKSFSEFTTNSAHSLSSAKIVDYYKQDAGFSKNDKVGVDKNSSSKKSIAYTVKNGSFVSTKGGAESSSNDYNNLKSTLNHEHYHKLAGQIINYTYQDHLDVYNKQMDDPLFKKTTNEYKLGVTGNYASYLLGGYDKGEFSIADVTKKIDDFNKKYAKEGTSIVVTGFMQGDNGLTLGAYGKDNKGRLAESKVVSKDKPQ